MGGADIIVSSPYSHETKKKPLVPMYAGDVDPIIEKHAANLKDFAYLTPQLDTFLKHDDVKVYAQDRT